MSDEFTLSHLSRPPADPTDGPAPALLLLHGYGSNMQDLMGLTPYLDPRLHILSAQGPLEMMAGMHAWYAIQMLPDGEFLIDEEQAAKSLELVDRFLDEIVDAYDLDPARLILGGFSQGAITSIAQFLRTPDRIAGLLVMSGRWPEGLDGVADPAAFQDRPVIAVHGTHDPVIPIRFGRQIRAHFEAMPVALTYEEYPMGHMVSAESLARIRGWLEGVVEGRMRE